MCQGAVCICSTKHMMPNLHHQIDIGDFLSADRKSNPLSHPSSLVPCLLVDPGAIEQQMLARFRV